VAVGQHDRDGDLGVARQRLLRVDAVGPQDGQRGAQDRIVGLEGLPLQADHLEDVAHHRLVEIDAAQVLDAVGASQQGEPTVVLDPHDRGVEGPAAQVVDGQHGSRLQAALAGVEPGRGDRFGDQVVDLQPHMTDGLSEQVELVLAPVRRMRHRQ
jgi:hypothetical protein